MGEEESLTKAKRPWLISKGQAKIQGMLRPSIWLPGVRDLHSIKEA